MKLEIVDDTELNISCDITVGNKKYHKRSCDRAISYELEQKEAMINVKVYKEDIWQPKRFLNSFFLKLYMLDCTFGNLSESENLPFSIDYQLTVTDVDTTTERILLSDIVEVDNDSLAQWKISSFFQCMLISLLIIVVGGILGFIFKGWLKLLFLICVVILSGTVFTAIGKKRRKLLEVLKTFI